MLDRFSKETNKWLKLVGGTFLDFQIIAKGLLFLSCYTQHSIAHESKGRLEEGKSSPTAALRSPLCDWLSLTLACGPLRRCDRR